MKIKVVHVVNTKIIYIFILVYMSFFLMTANICAQEKSNVNNHYLPYIQFEGTRFFNVIKARERFGVDLFVPLWQSLSNIVFTDVRMLVGSGKNFMESVHIGYRHLASEDKYLYGIYVAFGRKKTMFGHVFNQLAFGAECWFRRLFFSANLYQPIGKKIKSIIDDESDRYWIIKIDEEIAKVVDAEVGYEFIDGITGYAGGYYRREKNTPDNYGPKARLTYDWSLNNGNRILKIFDKCGFEIGIRRDKQRDVIWYLSANVRVGLLLSEKQALSGVSRHMIDLVHRDIDIVSITKENIVSITKENIDERNPYRV